MAGTGATVDFEVVDPTTPAATAAMDAYFAELDERFPTGFDPGPAAVGDMIAATQGAFVLASSDGRPVACGGVRSLGGEVCEIKRMWVHRDRRGAGLGSRLLRHLEATAAGLGYVTVRLDTNGALSEAIAMYARAGYRSIERYNDNPYAQAFFEKDLSGPR